MNEVLGFLAFVALPVAAVLWYYRDNGQPELVGPLQEEPPFPDVYTVGIWYDGYWVDTASYDVVDAEFDGAPSGAFEVVTFVVPQGERLGDHVADYKAANGYPL